MIKQENGNVLFYVLIAVALLAALSFAVTQSSRGNAEKVSEDRAQIYATELIEYANVVATAVAQLKLRGCKESEISFENAAVAGYTNANSPADNSCHVFETNGGGVTRSSANPEAMDASATPDNTWHIYGDTEIEEVGTTCGAAACSELLLIVDELDQTVCIKINDLLGVTNPVGIPPEDSDFVGANYTGTFSYAETVGDEVDSADLARKTAGCFHEDDASPEYAFYKVLLAR